MNVFVILPDQLFAADIQLLLNCSSIYIIEDPKYFIINFGAKAKARYVCPQKIILLRAAMRHFADHVSARAREQKHSVKVHYISYNEVVKAGGSDGDVTDNIATNDAISNSNDNIIGSGSNAASAPDFITYLRAEDIKGQVNMYWPASEHDYPDLLTAKFIGLPIHFYESPGFLLPRMEAAARTKAGAKMNQTAFYKKMRVLWVPELQKGPDVAAAATLSSVSVEKYKPVGGAWTYDQLNRETAAAMSAALAAKKLKLVSATALSASPFVAEARAYAAKVFKVKPIAGNIRYWPITRAEALARARHFVAKKLEAFGPWQDVVAHDSNAETLEPALFHSCLSSSINIGLITPKDIIELVIKEWRKNKTSIASVEGFLRQIVGWREFIRYNYLISHDKLSADIRGPKVNKGREPLPEYWFNAAEASIDLPSFLAGPLAQVRATGYTGHIARLMFFGNWFTLARIDYRDVYVWFMALFVDAYAWVMLPNVDMACWTSGLVGTRPYVCSAAYLRKMSVLDASAGAKDQLKTDTKKWNALYWAYIRDNRAALSKIYSFGPILSYWAKQTPSRKKELLFG
jgi:deoxyribodipyrimidine photolyase-related protein